MNAPAHASAYVNKRSLSRSHGVSMAVKASSNTHTDGVCERTGRRYSFSHLDGLVHHEMVYPDGAEPFDDYRAMWARIEKIERRRDFVLAHEVVMSLPSGTGLHRRASPRHDPDFRMAVPDDARRLRADRYLREY